MTVNSLENKHQIRKDYDHARSEGKRRVLRFLIKYLGFPLLAKLNKVEGLENVPDEGAAVLMINHIGFIDPLVVLNVVPRNIVPLAKIEAFTYPVVGIFPRIWEAIPIHREDVDRGALRKIFQVLKAGEIVLVAPEGTRGMQLQRGKVGVAYIASRSQVPVVPVALEGTQDFPAPRFSKPWRGPGASVRFGRPFRYKSEYHRADHDQLRKMTDEAMYILAEMLPKDRRGVYADQGNATQDTIEWC